MKKYLRIFSGILAVVAFVFLIRPAYNWGVSDAVFQGSTPEHCLRVPNADEKAKAQEEGILDSQGRMRIEGACWPAVWSTTGLLWAGRYP